MGKLSGWGPQFVALQNVEILQVTSRTMRCRVGERQVWLLRAHIMNHHLHQRGDCGPLVIPRWLALERGLL